jgi:hypothetical protein
MSELFRVYEPDECAPDGYPFVWRDEIIVGARRFQGVKDVVRQQAGNRCVRCGHPYEKGMGEWSPCDHLCRHQDNGPVRVVSPDGELLAHYEAYNGGLETARAGWLADDAPSCRIEAQWRILTTHHLNGQKNDLRWWNLVSLCQKDHLSIQGRVKMERAFIFEHSHWFKIYAAGYYGWKYLDEDLTREQVEARLDELLALERQDVPA